MTDPTPHDSSYLDHMKWLTSSTQREHAPGPEPLSPAAEAVLDAALPHQVHRYAAAAAIRALADQAIPMIQSPWSSTFVPVLTAMESREKMLAIAAELENAP